MSQTASPYEFKIRPTGAADSSSTVRVQYSTVRDVYSISSNNEEKKDIIRRWSAGAHSYSNIIHKIEHDWKMCYLARTEGSSNAFIEWQFDLLADDPNDKRLRKLDLAFESKSFESGKIELGLKVVLADGLCRQFKLNNEMTNDNLVVWSSNNGVYTIDLREFGSANNLVKKVKVRADLSLGSGDHAWQHTQLFRQSLNDERCLFDVVFYF